MAPDEPLPSWNDTPTRAAIMEFVARVTGDGPDQLPAEQRVATFDNDGTPWCEKPMPIQLDFTIRRIAAMAEADATLRDQQPWKAAYEHDLGWLGTAMVKHYHGDDSDLALLMTAVPQAFGGLTVEAYADEVDRFFRAADHPQLGRPYMTCRCSSCSATSRITGSPHTSPRAATGTSCDPWPATSTGCRRSG
jgi:hypothetical protein